MESIEDMEDDREEWPGQNNLRLQEEINWEIATLQRFVFDLFLQSLFYVLIFHSNVS